MNDEENKQYHPKKAVCIIHGIAIPEQVVKRKITMFKNGIYHSSASTNSSVPGLVLDETLGNQWGLSENSSEDNGQLKKTRGLSSLSLLK